jgi:hypothetical protein
MSSDDYFVIASRPNAGGDAAPRPSRLALALEAADPEVVIALDDDAADDLTAAFEIARLTPGQPVRVRGRVLGAAGDLGSSLSDAATKARVWRAMKEIAAAGGLKAAGRQKGAPKKTALDEKDS